jgi:SAM-dependent methyltransferase
LMKMAGFDAMGVELSPWIAEYAAKTFDVPVHCGTLADLDIAPHSLDCVILMDVLEHLLDPKATMGAVAEVLKPDGIVVIQTPCYRDDGPNWEMLIDQEHLFLFTEDGLHRLLSEVGLPHVVLRPQLFPHDMFLIACRSPLTEVSQETAEVPTLQTPTGRALLAMLDLQARLTTSREDWRQRLSALEADRVARLRVIEEQGGRLSALEAERNALRAELNDLGQQFSVVEADRAARFEVIQRQGAEIAQLQAEVHHWLAANKLLGQQVVTLETERNTLTAQLEVTQGIIQIVRQTRMYRLLRRLGRWRFMDQMVASALTTPAPGSLPETVEFAVSQVIEPEALAPSSSASVQLLSSQPEGRDDQASEFEACYAKVREPKVRAGVDYPEGAEDRIVRRLRNFGIKVYDYEIDVDDYRQYFAAARYLEDFPNYYPFNLPEKSLEHYLAAKLLQLREQDIYIDIASQNSPVPEIYHRLFGAVTYRQDIAYPLGLNGDMIGGDAAHISVPDEFASKMALHCSFEHFEGDSDIGFIREILRILKPGGIVCVVPLYLFEEYAIQIDPVVTLPDGVIFEEDAVIYCLQGWNNRHGRFYDPEHLVSRICNNLDRLEIEVYRIKNFKQVDESCYGRFAMSIKKPLVS